MRYYQTKKGYYYKEYKNGKKMRISDKEYHKNLKSKSNKYDRKKKKNFLKEGGFYDEEYKLTDDFSLVWGKSGEFSIKKRLGEIKKVPKSSELENRIKKKK